MRFWHYTAYPSLVKIVDDRTIRRDRTVVVGNEFSVVWLSTNPNWEETVRKSLLNTQTGKETGPLSRDELSKQGFPPVRIEVNQNLVNIRSWRHYKKNGDISRKNATSLEKLAKRWGANPKEWHVSYEDIPLASCLIPIEIWTSRGEWVDIEGVLEKPTA